MKKTKNGFALIEVLVSLLLLSMVMLSFNAAAIYALRQQQKIFYLNVAIQQVYSMIERLRSLGHFSGLEKQIIIWNKQNQAILPHGRGVVSGAYPSYTVALFWGSHHDNDRCHAESVDCLTEKVMG